MGLKSAIEIAMERTQAMVKDLSLSEEQKRQIAEIRQKYGAKIAECEIMISDPEERARQIARLERERDERIRSIREGS